MLLQGLDVRAYASGRVAASTKLARRLFRAQRNECGTIAMKAGERLRRSRSRTKPCLLKGRKKALAREERAGSSTRPSDGVHPEFFRQFHPPERGNFLSRRTGRNLSCCAFAAQDGSNAQAAQRQFNPSIPIPGRQVAAQHLRPPTEVRARRAKLDVGRSIAVPAHVRPCLP